MKAIVHDAYGPPDVLRLEAVDQPTPRDDELLVKVHAAAVTRTDAGYRAAHPFIMHFFTGLVRPKRRILGSEFAGEVVAVGAAVTQLAAGDRVFGTTGFRLGAHAEYLCVRESAKVAHQPAGLSYAEAASICEGALYALTVLRYARVLKGQRLLVYGASGAIGTAAVQLAKHLGAHVTAVCSTRNVEIVRALGPDAVIDYTQEDFTRSGETYDVILDAVCKHSFRRCRRSLAAGGAYVSLDPGFMWHVPLLALLTARLGDKKVLLPWAAPGTTKQDLLFIKELIEAGTYRPVVDRTYPLDQVVEAARYVDTARKTGNVVLTIAGDREAHRGRLTYMTQSASQPSEPILFYSKSDCPWARAVRQLLDQHGLKYEERPTDQSPAFLEELRRDTGQAEQPTLKIGGQWLVDTDAKAVAKHLGLPEPASNKIAA